jgi:fatty acid desaturase
MDDPKTAYKKLPGKKRTSLWRHRLYLADDHILSVSTGTFSFAEHYKRFHFKDIQAITLRRTWSALIKTIAAFVIVALLALAAWGIGQDGGQFFAVLAAIVLIPGIYSLIIGHSCRCFIQTAVQVEELHSLNRIRTARKVLNTLVPLISQAQGEFTAEHKGLYEREKPSPAPVGQQVPTPGAP